LLGNQAAHHQSFPVLSVVDNQPADTQHESCCSDSHERHWGEVVEEPLIKVGSEIGIIFVCEDQQEEKEDDEESL